MKTKGNLNKSVEPTSAMASWVFSWVWMAELANFAKLVRAVLLLYQSPPPLYFSLHKPNGLGWVEEIVE
jgi:hypothetical protein